MVIDFCVCKGFLGIWFGAVGLIANLLEDCLGISDCHIKGWAIRSCSVVWVECIVMPVVCRGLTLLRDAVMVWVIWCCSCYGRYCVGTYCKCFPDRKSLVGSIRYIRVLKSRVGSSGFVALMGDYVSELIAIVCRQEISWRMIRSSDFQNKVLKD